MKKYIYTFITFLLLGVILIPMIPREKEIITIEKQVIVDGINGKEVTFQVSEGFIQWQYVGDTTWTNLIDLQTITGADGINGIDGADGREVLFQVADGFIQWQYTGDTTWINLVELTSLVGEIIDLNEMAYFNYASSIYGAKYNLLATAWQDMKESETVLFDIPLTLAAPNQEMGGMTIDLYVGTDGQLQSFYDACVNETILFTSDVYYVNNVATNYNGDVSGDFGFSIPLYNFGYFNVDDSTSFLIGDLTPLDMGLGLVLAKIANVSIPNNNIVIQQGFEFENESGIIISDSVTSISYGFQNWTSNNQPLVIPNSVTSISYAFMNWETNNQPLVIPNSVTSIGEFAFSNWTSNNQPLVIPNSVTNIGEYAFYNWISVPYVEIQTITPPTLAHINAFDYQNDAPIYVPDGSVEVYKTAINWVDLADRIFPISDRGI